MGRACALTCLQRGDLADQWGAGAASDKKHNKVALELLREKRAGAASDNKHNNMPNISCLVALEFINAFYLLFHDIPVPTCFQPLHILLGGTRVHKCIVLTLS